MEVNVFVRYASSKPLAVGRSFFFHTNIADRTLIFVVRMHLFECSVHKPRKTNLLNNDSLSWCVVLIAYIAIFALSLFSILVIWIFKPINTSTLRIYFSSAVCDWDITAQRIMFINLYSLHMFTRLLGGPNPSLLPIFAVYLWCQFNKIFTNRGTKGSTIENWHGRKRFRTSSPGFIMEIVLVSGQVCI